MDIRFVGLITTFWFAVSSGPARAELQPKDPRIDAAASGLQDGKDGSAA
jgi:hypothetical protein